MAFDNIRRKRRFSLLGVSAHLLCGVALSVFGTSASHADDGSLRILTLNIWDKYKSNPQVITDFLTKGNFDVLTFQEVNDAFVTGLPRTLNNAGIGTYVGQRINDLGIFSKLPGTLGSYKSATNTGQGQYVNYAIVDADGGRPQTLIGTVHLDYGDGSAKRIAEVKALNSWAKSATMPTILTGDFNAGDVSERGLHSVSQQELLLRIHTNSANSFYYDLLRQYAKDDAALDKFIGDWKGKGSAAINSAPIPKGLFADETYAVDGNTPQTMNILKKQFMLLQTEDDRELFAPHEKNDGRGTWTSAFYDSTNTWGSWHRVKIDHLMAARPFGKWYAVDDKPNDPYAGVINDVTTTLPNGTKIGISDHEPVARTLKWIGPVLETYTENVDAIAVKKTRLVWGADAPVFDENGGSFYLTRNNMRTDVYLGQIADENGIPTLTGLTLEEKKTLLDCKSTESRFQKAIAEYCIDDHSFIGETLVTDGGTVVVDEDAALGTPDASLHLDNGTLRIAGTAMAQLDRSLVLEAGGGALDIADAGNAVAIDRAISGTGSLTKLGQGALGLFGTNSYTGETMVRSGLLVVNGSIAASSQTTVFDGGAIAGSGTTGNLRIAAGGTVAPGNSIGTLNVAGNLSFAQGAFYQVEVDAQGNSDLIKVTGATTIEGGTVIGLAADGNYRPQTGYTILSSAGGITGQFGAVSSNLAFLDGNFTYGANDIVLTLERNDTAFDQVGYTSNQQSAARGAESLGMGNALYDAIVMQDASTARSIFTQIGGEVHASTYGVLIQNGHFVRDAMDERLRAASGDAGGQEMSVLGYDANGPKQVAADTEQFAVWGRTFGSWSDVDGNDNASGLSSTEGGLFAGADAAVGNGWRVGLLAGYSQTSVDLDDLAASGDSDNYHIGFYAGTRSGPFALRLGTAYTWHSVDTSRQVSIASINEQLSSDYDASTTQAFGEAAYRFDMGRSALEPFVNLAYVYLSNDGFNETGGIAALNGQDGNLDTLFTTLGLRASTSFDIGRTVATLHGTVGWQHASGDILPQSVAAFAGGDVFTTYGAPIAEDVALLSARIDFAATANATLGIGYTGQFGSGLSDNGVTGTLSIKF